MRKRIPIFICLLLVCAAVWLLATSNKMIRQFIEHVDFLGYDLQLRTHVLTKKDVPQSPVAIIDIDDKSLQVIGRWPWPRKKLGELTALLKKEGAAVIAFDMFFSEPQHNIANEVLAEINKNKLTQDQQVELFLQKSLSLFDEDAAFAKSLSTVQAVLAMGFLPRDRTQNALPPPLLTLTPQQTKELTLFNAKGYISNIPILQNAAKAAGFINIYPDDDGIVRRAPLIISYQDKIYPSLALQAVLSFTGSPVNLITPFYNHSISLEGLKLGTNTIPTDAYGQVLIPFIGRSFTFPYYSALDIFQGKIPKDALLGKIIFVGTSATGSGDLQSTSIQSPFPGVEIQATLVNGLLQNNFSSIPAWTFGANIMLIIFLGVPAAFIFPYLGPRILALIIILLPPFLLFMNNWIWEDTGLILSFFIPVILLLILSIFNLIYGYLFETRRREHLKEMFGQYVPEKHIDEMLKTTANYALQGEDREMSVLFADIRNFTTISESLSAAELVDMLNTFFTPMTEIIFKHRGTIDKYIGDLIMAFWAAPLKDKYHARHAIESALDMQEKIKDMKNILTQHGWPEIKMGIGINTGIMSVGDMGSLYRRNYTVLGDAVNLASRVEGLSKFYGVNIVVTEQTAHEQQKFIFRKLDLVRVKGKKNAIAIYEVVDRQEQVNTEVKEEIKSFEQALNLYMQQKWDESLQLLEQLNNAHTQMIYKIFMDRIKEFKLHPPAPDWDGVYVHFEK